MKKRSWQLIALGAHFLLCVLFSFPWKFLEGMYLGFIATFFILWGLSLPVLSAAIGAICSIRDIRRKATAMDIVIAVSSAMILIAYLVSGVGLLRNVTLNFVYVAIALMTVLLWGSGILKCLKREK